MEKIQEILNKGWNSYNKNHKVIGYKKKAITAIGDCKTGAIGAHKYVCDESRAVKKVSWSNNMC